MYLGLFGGPCCCPCERQKVKVVVKMEGSQCLRDAKEVRWTGLGDMLNMAE